MAKRRSRRARRRPAGELEAEVLAALWASGRPMTPREVQRELDSDLAYTTVMTALSRLNEKRAVERRRSGRGYAYSPVLDRAGIAAARMRELLDSRDDRAAVLARFVGSLSPEDERLLADMLAQSDADEHSR